MRPYWNALRAEALKQKRSLALALVLLGGAFVPAITLLMRLNRPERLPALYRSGRMWQQLWHQAWQPMAVMLLPLGVVLVATLVTQVESRANAWKQLHTTPLPGPAIFLSKLAVLLGLVAGIFVVFDVTLLVVAWVPPALHDYIPRPPGGMPLGWLWRQNVTGYLAVLPIVTLQFALGLRFRHFLAPLGVGTALWLAAVMGMSWRYNWTLPYGYGGLADLEATNGAPLRHLPADLRLLALAVATLFGLAAAYEFGRRRDRD